LSQRQERQRFIRHYKEVMGETEINMHKVAEFAKAQGWDMPQPPSDIDLLAKKFTEDAQAERRYDEKTGRPYRAYHALPVQSGQLNLFVYIDIDDATRPQMHKSAVHRREQMVSDGYQLTLDLDHWNSVHPEAQPIELPMDITLDIEIRKAMADQDDEDKAA